MLSPRRLRPTGGCAQSALEGGRDGDIQGITLMGEQCGPRQLVDHAVAAEAAGFDFLVASDHYYPWLDQQGQALGFVRAEIVDDDNLKIAAIILANERFNGTADGCCFVPGRHYGHHARPGLQIVVRLAIVIKWPKQPESSSKKNESNPDNERKDREDYGERGHSILCRENGFRG